MSECWAFFFFLQSWMEDVSSPGPPAGAAAYQRARRVFPRGSVRRGMRMGAVPCSTSSARVQVCRLLKQHETMNHFYCSYAIGDWVFHFYIRIQIHHFIFIFHPKNKRDVSAEASLWCQKNNKQQKKQHLY